MKRVFMLFSMMLLAFLVMGTPAMAQRSRGNGGKQNHSAPRERGVDRGHGRNEGRRIDEGYRRDHFGRDNHVRLSFYGERTFVFGGIYFGLDVWPSFWLASDYVYVDYVDGDYFLVNERFPDARVAIIIE
jgi:hypothetical protein